MFFQNKRLGLNKYIITLNDDEKIVFNLLSDSKKITQFQISKAEQWLGSHPVHEADLNINHEQSTLRKIRQIIRDLRINHGLMILSDAKGYWIMKTEEEAKEYLDRIEKMAKAQAKAWFLTYKAMKKNHDVNSEYFNKQSMLFESN